MSLSRKTNDAKNLLDDDNDAVVNIPPLIRSVPQPNTPRNIRKYQFRKRINCSDGIAGASYNIVCAAGSSRVDLTLLSSRIIKITY